MRDIIQRAVDGGFEIPYDNFEIWEDGTIAFTDSGSNLVIDSLIHYDHIIFSHPFLKAFFGEASLCIMDGGERRREGHCSICGGQYETIFLDAWQYHAQQLVLAKDRIEYLRRYLTKG